MGMNQPRPTETNRSLPIALLRAREKVMGPIRNMLSNAGVTEQQWRVLRVLDEMGTLDPTEIADRSCLLLPSLTRILQTLQSKQLILREPHPTDRRKQQISISKAGRQLILDNMEESQQLTTWLEDEFGQILVGGRDDPRIHRDGLSGAHHEDFLVLEDAEKLDLHRQACLTDLIQKDGAPLDRQEEAGPGV